MSLGPMRYRLPHAESTARCVWVHLDALWQRPDPELRRMVGDGLDGTGRARGMLTGWLRTSDGLWLGEVHLEIGYIDGRRQRQIWRCQLVPAWALSPRHDGRPLGS